MAAPEIDLGGEERAVVEARRVLDDGVAHLFQELRGVCEGGRSSGSSGRPDQASVVTAMRRRPAGCAISARKGVAGRGISKGSPIAGPSTASNMAAQSRTVRVSTKPTTMPL